jgi:DNA invertase Pin-like site-specific DNA recombinase
MDLGYARVSTVKQDLDRQIDTLEKPGIPRTRLYRHLSRASGAHERLTAPHRPTGLALLTLRTGQASSSC